MAAPSKVKASAKKPHDTTFMLERPRLLEPLAAAEDKKLIAVLAPAGFGKTTLLKQHTARSRRKTAWLTLRDDAADASTLARDTMYALQSIIPNMSFSHTKEALSIEARGNRLGVTLARDLNVINANLNIVFDRIEHLSTSSSSLVEALVEELGEGHQVLVAGYEGNPLPVSRFAVDGFALALNSSELNFTAEETVELLKARGFEGDAEQAHESMAGWSLGIAMVSIGSSLPTHPSEVINQLFKRLPQDIQQWLPELAVLDVWSEDFARQFECLVPQGWLGKLLSRGLPIFPINRLSYQIHSLMSAFLDEKLKENRSRYSKLHYNAGKIFERHKKYIESIKHYMNSGFEEDAFRVIKEVSLELINKGETEIVKTILEAIPEEKLSEEMLILLANRRLSSGEEKRAKKDLEKLYENKNRDPNLLISLSILAQRDGDFDRQISLIDEALAQNPQGNTLCRALHNKASALDLKKEFLESQKYLEKSLEVSQEIGNSSSVAASMSNLAISFENQGYYSRAEAYYVKAEKILENIGNMHLYMQNTSNFIGLLLTVGDLERARGYINKGLKISKKIGNYWQAFFAENDGYFDFLNRDFAQAADKLKISVKLYEHFEYSYWVCPVKSLIVQCMIFLGKENEARKELDELYVMSRGGNKEVFYEIPKAIYEFSQGNLSLAKNIFEKHNYYVYKTEAVRVLAYRAEAARREGKNWKVIMKELFKELDKLGHDSLLQVDRFLLDGLYNECIRRGFFKNELQKMFKVKPFETPKSVILLELKTLEANVFYLLGQKIKISLRKSKELLLWLAIQGSSRRHEIIKGLWDEDNIKNREYFKIAIRKLRCALLENTLIQIEPILFQDGLYKLHPLIEVEWDFKVLQQKLHRGALSKEKLDCISSLPTKFLATLSAEWIQSFKQGVLDSMYSTLIETSAKSEVFRASELLETAIALDPLSEEAYKKLAAVLKQSGRADEAARVQQRFIAALES
jgi:LuxR family transcriptional regulator, maltose regulon positive regulatory protein